MQIFLAIYDFIKNSVGENWPSTIISIAFSSIIAWGISILIFRRKATSEYNYRLFNLYHKMCQEIITIILPLTDIPLRNSKGINLNKNEKITNELSDVFYKYYNYLPDEVLMSIVCLHCCIRNGSNIPYIYAKKRNKIIVKPCNTKKDLIFLLKKTSIENYLRPRKDSQFAYRIKESYKYAVNCNLSYFKKIQRFYKAYTFQIPMDDTYPRSFVLNIQARYVIVCIDKYFGSKHLQNWSKSMKKRTLA